MGPFFLRPWVSTSPAREAAPDHRARGEKEPGGRKSGAGGQQGPAHQGGHPKAGVEHRAPFVPRPPGDVELHPHTGQDLREAQADADDQQQNRVRDGIDEFGHDEIHMEKALRDSFGRVAENAAEHETPRDGGDPAILEQLQAPIHPRLRPEFPPQEPRAEEKEQAVPRVGEHHAEKEVIEKADDGGGVHVAGERHGVHFGDRFRRRGEAAVVQLDRRGLGIRVLHLQRGGSQRLQLLFEKGQIRFGNIPGDHKGVPRMADEADGAVFLRPDGEIVGRVLHRPPLFSEGAQFPIRLLHGEGQGR